ncbi:MAG: 30S ribosomal protein S5 [Candidatus Diapherotrites archaeon CG10_big_fil_rev_8_21_14_0_10_31_34]|nr:MAG: 30S ribosomal protein S5 [Candidatus Diapherotrites archaeon CG10_big_fil_rev_8_21_14_0_10_31_34]
MAQKPKRERREREKKKPEEIEWIPKTVLGKKVKSGEIATMKEAMESKLPLIEPAIIDYLLRDLEEKMVDFKKTTKVRRAGRQFSFRATVIIGDKNEFIGIGTGKHKEKWPAIRKATRRAKLNLIRVRKGCGSWECTCGTGHSIPFKVTGSCGAVKINLLPAPKGTGLVVGNNIKDVFNFVGIKDVWSKTRGATDTKLNFIRATIDALSQTTSMKVSEEIKKKISK